MVDSVRNNILISVSRSNDCCVENFHFYGTCTSVYIFPRLHYAVQAYKELLLYIQEMSHSKSERENSKVMQSNLFYHPDYRDIFVTLLRNFYEVFQTTASLRDTIECTHIFVRMIESYCSENKHLVVRETRKRSKKKGKSSKKGKHSFHSCCNDLKSSF